MTEPEWDPQEEWMEEEERETRSSLKAEQRRRMTWLSVIGGLLVAGGLGLTVWLLIEYERVGDSEERIERLEKITEERDADLGRLVDGVDQLREQVGELGAIPVVPSAEELVAETGATDPDDPEIQDSEVNDPDPFNDPDPNDPELDDPDPNDPENQDPELGDEISFSELLAAVTAFCNTHNNCQGPSGDDGQDGTNGTTTCPPGFHFTTVKIPSSPDQIFLICVQD